MPEFDIVIVGGGFCGVHVAKLLEKKLPQGYTAALIDHKEYFEFTPGVPKLVLNPSHAENIRVPFKDLFKRVHFVKGEVTKISPKQVHTKSQSFTFRHLVIASGVAYPIGVKSTGVYTLKNGDEVRKFHDALQLAKSVVIVGGGLVATELAGELVTKTDKKVIMIEPGTRLLCRNAERASAWVSHYLSKRGCKILYGERAVKHEKGAIVTERGTKIPADLVAWCAGIKPESGFLEGALKDAVTEKKNIKVNNFLQVNGFPNIFCGGDLNSIVEEKTAQNADRQARVIVHNLLVLLGKKNLMIVHRPRSGPLIISLGDWAGLMIYGNLVLKGFIPGILKHVVEKILLFQIKYL